MFLKRFVYVRTASSTDGTFGTVTHEGRLVCLFGEPPWVGNKRDESCIPAGIYRCSRYKSNTHGWCYKVHNVPGRVAVRIHKGNSLQDTLGCQYPGMRPARVTERDGVVRDGLALSAVAMGEIQKVLDGDHEFELHIKEVLS